MRHRKKMKPNKPRNILLTLLRNMWLGDEIICTNRTYENIKGRVDSFAKSRKDRRLDIIPCGAIRKIRRTI